MALLITAITWIFGGGILRTIAAGAIVAPLAFGAGYWKGHSSADQSAELRRLNSIIVNLEFEAAAKEKAERAAAELAAASAAAETANDATTMDIDNAIRTAPEVPSGITADFLGGLRKLK